MASGGARNRSGPPVDPKSGRSDRRGLKWDQLPAEGYQGEAPGFPLVPYTLYEDAYDEGERFEVEDLAGTTAFRDREQTLWAWAWTTPQAAAWAREPWRLQAVAMWVRTSVICETSEATAADRGSLHRFADQIGLTPAGLRENGWQIVRDEVAERRAEQVAVESPAKPQRRLRVAGDE